MPADPLSVVDSVGRVLARFDGEDHGTGHAEALRLLAEGFGASISTVLRFDPDGAHLVGLWAGGRYIRDPQVRLGNDRSCVARPVGSSRELGCRRAQGWLWSPAVPAAEVPRLARV